MEFPSLEVNTTWNRVWILGTKRRGRPEAQSFLEEMEVICRFGEVGFPWSRCADDSAKGCLRNIFASLFHGFQTVFIPHNAK